VTQSKMEQYFKENSDKNNLFQQEKISRYLDFRKLYNKLNKSIKADGAVISVENGKQKFVKVNPAVSEKEKLNTQLLNLEKELYSSIEMSKIKARKSVHKTPPKEDKGGLV